MPNRGPDRRREERRKDNTPVAQEKRTGEERRTEKDRRSGEDKQN